MKDYEVKFKKFGTQYPIQPLHLRKKPSEKRLSIIIFFQKFGVYLYFQILINRPLEGSKQDLESQSLIEVGQASAGGLVAKR